MTVITNWKVINPNFKPTKLDNDFLEVKERASLYVFYYKNADQATCPFLSHETYEDIVSGKVDYSWRYTTYEITETTPRVRTMKFTSPGFIDPAKAQWRVLLVHPNHEAFYGFIIDHDYDESTELYTYQCQDGSRAYQSKSRGWSAKPQRKYDRLRQLLMGGVGSNNVGTYDAQSLSGLRNIEYYNQKAYGNVKACNPLAGVMPQYLSYDSFIEQIRGLCLSDGALIDVYFDKYGVCQIESFSGDVDVPLIYFSLKDMSSATYSMDKTNVITEIQVKRDKTNVSPSYFTNTLFKIPVTFYFGMNLGYMDAIDTTGLPTVQSQSTEDNNSANTNANVNTGTTNNVITVNMMPSCGCHGGKVAYKKYTKSFKNYCPMCKRTGTLTNNPKGVYEGEITCGNTGPACKNLGGAGKKIKGCDADYCGYCGTEKNGTCRSRLTPATSADTSTSTTNNTGTTANTDGTTTTTTTTQVDYNSQEYQDREMQEAVNKMQESFVNMFEYKMKIPLNHPLFKHLHTNLKIFAELPEGWTLENIDKWDNLFFGESSFWTTYVLNRYYIHSMKITGDKDGTWAELTISPFAASRSSYTSWMRKTEQAYASATAAQTNTTNNNTGTGTGGGTTGTARLGNDCTATNSMRAMSGGGYGNSGHGRNFDASSQKGYAVQGANYYNWARQYKDISSLCKAMAKRFKYVLYSNNRTCPQRLHNNGGTISCNCYDACRYVKVCCDSCGFPCVIITGSIWGWGHGWNAVKYNGKWYTFDLCFTAKGNSTNATNSFRAVW